VRLRPPKTLNNKAKSPFFSPSSLFLAYPRISVQKEKVAVALLLARDISIDCVSIVRPQEDEVNAPKAAPPGQQIHHKATGHDAFPRRWQPASVVCGRHYLRDSCCSPSGPTHCKDTCLQVSRNRFLISPSLVCPLSPFYLTAIYCSKDPPQTRTSPSTRCAW
jgi:hypothetical protein